jgi:hypothetical protein
VDGIAAGLVTARRVPDGFELVSDLEGSPEVLGVVSPGSEWFDRFDAEGDVSLWQVDMLYEGDRVHVHWELVGEV